MSASVPAFVGLWTAMMAAMMLPSLVPTILLFGTVTKSRGQWGMTPVPTFVFVTGYFVAWALLGALVSAGSHFAPTSTEAQRWAAAAALFAGGAYQLTPLKARCLAHCRSPMHFFMGSWRDGPAGALQLGMHHGFYCVACCWGLMAALIALGMMRPLWMVVIALMIFIEKTVPGGPRLAPLFGLLLIAAGGAVMAGVMWTGAPMGGM